MTLSDRFPVIELWLSLLMIVLTPAAFVFAQVQSSYDVGPKFENVVAGDQFIGAEVVGANGEKYEIRDGLIEPLAGSAVLVVLREKNSEKEFAVPPAIIDGESNQMKLTRAIGDDVQQRSAELLKRDSFPVAAVNTYLAATFPDHKLPVKKDEPESRAEGVLRFSKLADLDVVDNSDKEIGNIKTAVIDSDNARIAYLLVRLSADNQLRAIPLGAFEYYYADDAWKINLAGERIAKFPPIESEDALPKELDRGWVEYVAVRFGRNTLQDPVATEGR